MADYLGEYSRENGLQSLEDPHVGCGWMAEISWGDIVWHIMWHVSNLFGVNFCGTNMAGEIMLWYGSVGRNLVMVADLIVTDHGYKGSLY